VSNQDSRTDVAPSISEQEFRLLVDTIPTLVWSAGSDGNIDYVNKRALEYFGAPLNEIIGWGWTGKAHPEDVAFKTRTWLANLESGIAHNVDCRFRGADGRYRWFAVSGAPLKAGDGRVIRWHGVLIDIDDRKKAEEALRESEDKLRQIIETVPGLIWSADPAGEPTQFNQRLLDYSGVRLEDFQHGGWETFLHPADFPKTAKAFYHAIQTGTSYEAVHRLRRSDGEYRWHHARGEPLHDREGRIVQWYGLSVDIDDRMKAEEALRSSEYNLQKIIETVPSHLWSTDAVGEPTQFSQRALDYYGIQLEDFKRGGWENYVHPDDYPETARAFYHAIQTGTSYQDVVRLRRADGEFRWHDARAEPLRDRQGRIVQWYGLSVDIDDAKKAEDRLRRSEANLAEAQRLTHCGVSVYNETTLLYASEEIYRIWGFDPAQGVPSLEAMWQRVHPDDLAQVQRGWDKKPNYSLAYRIVLPDGTVKHLESIGQPVRSESGELKEFVTTQIDVTERKRAEEAIRESEYKLRQIIETVPTFLWSTETDGKVSYVNQRILDYCGVRLEDFVQNGWGAFLHSDDLPETVRAFSHAIETGTSHEAVHRVRRSDGEYRWFHSRSEPLRDQQGCIVQWYGLSMDIDEAKKAEDRLRSSEAYLAEAQKLSRTGTAVYTDTTNFYWSDETYRILGFDPRNGLPSRDATVQMIHPDDRGPALEVARRSLREKRDYGFEFRFVTPTGIKYIEGSAHPKFSASGELVEIVSTIIDVTERKRAEEALRESEHRWRSAIDGIAGLVSIHFPNGEVETVNRQCLEYFGRSLEWLKNWGTNDAVHPDDFPRVVEMFTRAMASGIPFQIDQRLRRFDGEYRWFNNRGVPIRDDSERIVRWYVLITDIEDRKRAQDALRSALDGIAGLVAILAANGEVETANRQVFEYFGLSREELKQWGTSDAVHPEDLPGVLEIFERGMTSGTPFNQEIRIRRFDGEYRRFEVRYVPVRDESGRIARWYVLLTDIEDRTRALARLEQMQSDFAHMNRVSVMGELTASLSHEISQPIAAARNYARAALNFLDQQPPDLGEVKKQLGSVVSAQDRSGEIIDRIRDHIKKAPPRKINFDLNHAIDEVIVLARSAISRNEVSVQTLLLEGLAPVHGDRVQLQQVLLNLILNAVEAMGSIEEGPRELLISTEQNQTKGTLVAVGDSGPGLGPDNLERVFDAFYTTKTSGMGMGLSICRSIIDAHGGRLWAEANAPRGTVFQFILPSVAGQIAEAQGK